MSKESLQLGDFDFDFRPASGADRNNTVYFPIHIRKVDDDKTETLLLAGALRIVIEAFPTLLALSETDYDPATGFPEFDKLTGDPLVVPNTSSGYSDEYISFTKKLSDELKTQENSLRDSLKYVSGLENEVSDTLHKGLFGSCSELLTNLSKPIAGDMRSRLGKFDRAYAVHRLAFKHPVYGNWMIKMEEKPSVQAVLDAREDPIKQAKLHKDAVSQVDKGIKLLGKIGPFFSGEMTCRSLMPEEFTETKLALLWDEKLKEYDVELAEWNKVKRELNSICYAGRNTRECNFSGSMINDTMKALAEYLRTPPQHRNLSANFGLRKNFDNAFALNTSSAEVDVFQQRNLTAVVFENGNHARGALENSLKTFHLERLGCYLPLYKPSPSNAGQTLGQKLALDAEIGAVYRDNAKDNVGTKGFVKIGVKLDRGSDGRARIRAIRFQEFTSEDVTELKAWAGVDGNRVSDGCKSLLDDLQSGI